MPKSLDQFRRDAKALRRAYEAGDADAMTFLKSGLGALPDRPLKHADYLHAIARAEGFPSWPALKAAAEVHGMDRAARIAALTRAAALGQAEIARALMEADPGLDTATPGLAAAFYRPEALQGFLDRGEALAAEGSAPPFIHLCRSRMWSHLPERAGAMIACASLDQMRQRVPHGLQLRDLLVDVVQVLAAQFLRTQPSLVLLQDSNDLLFAETASLHRLSPHSRHACAR